jgi:hypothetical protein
MHSLLSLEYENDTHFSPTLFFYPVIIRGYLVIFSIGLCLYANVKYKDRRTDRSEDREWGKYVISFMVCHLSSAVTILLHQETHLNLPSSDINLLTMCSRLPTKCKLHYPSQF